MNGIIFFKKLKIIRIILDVQKSIRYRIEFLPHYCPVLAWLVPYLSAPRNTYWHISVTSIVCVWTPCFSPPVMSPFFSSSGSYIIFFLYNFNRLVWRCKRPRMVIDYSLVLSSTWQSLSFLIFHDFAYFGKYWPGARRMSPNKALPDNFLWGNQVGKVWLMSAKLLLDWSENFLCYSWNHDSV